MPDVKAARYRPMEEADVSAAMLIRKAAMDWLTRSEGREPPPWTPRHSNILRHLLSTDAGGSWVCEVAGTVVGFSQAHVRGDIWFLAQLFVLPELHAAGVGGELLRLAQQYGGARGARVYSVVASTSPAGQALYMRAGMFAIGIGYRMMGAFEPLTALAEPDKAATPLRGVAERQDEIAALDRQVFGAERRQDHAWYLSGGMSDAESTSFGLTRDGSLAGYGYADTDGFVAPIAAYDPDDQRALLRTAAEWLAERGVERGSIWVVSYNHTMMSALLAAGWRVGGWSFLLASEPFGQFDRYHPAGGILL
ncbi:MAG: GNAT family N-acetyltransferase [Chloroflexi bacterium]|nr:GNAT family N-acetyltransferase [Chloroflexota bacterium]